MSSALPKIASALPESPALRSVPTEALVWTTYLSPSGLTVLARAIRKTRLPDAFETCALQKSFPEAWIDTVTREEWFEEVPESGHSGRMWILQDSLVLKRGEGFLRSGAALCTPCFRRVWHSFAGEDRFWGYWDLRARNRAKGEGNAA